MKVIVAGSRGITSYEAVCEAIRTSGFSITIVVSGGARGVDTLGERWAREYGAECVRMPADWNRHGRRAGYLRNMQMARYAEALVAVWDGASLGTKHMIDIAQQHGLKVFVHSV